MTDNLTPPGIPAVFVEAAKEAGESLEGWRPVEGLELEEVIRRIRVPNALGSFDNEVMWMRTDASIRWSCGPRDSIAFATSLPDAIRLANRLVRALTGETEGEK